MNAECRRPKLRAFARVGETIFGLNCSLEPVENVASMHSAATPQVAGVELAARSSAYESQATTPTIGDVADAEPPLRDENCGDAAAASVETNQPLSHRALVRLESMQPQFDGLLQVDPTSTLIGAGMCASEQLGVASLVDPTAALLCGSGGGSNGDSPNETTSTSASSFVDLSWPSNENAVSAIARLRSARSLAHSRSSRALVVCICAERLRLCALAHAELRLRWRRLRRRIQRRRPQQLFRGDRLSAGRRPLLRPRAGYRLLVVVRRRGEGACRCRRRCRRRCSRRASWIGARRGGADLQRDAKRSSRLRSGLLFSWPMLSVQISLWHLAVFSRSIVAIFCSSAFAFSCRIIKTTKITRL